MSRYAFALPCGLLMALAAAPLFAQPAGQARRAVTSNEMVTTADRWQIPFTYHQSAAGKDAPVVILLHMRGSNRNEWKSNGVAEELQRQGYAVIAPDLRQHGEAKPVGGTASGPDAMKARDYRTMAGPGGELEALKLFLFEEHQKEKLNMAKLAIVAPGMTAPIAANWAAYDWSKPPYNDAPVVATRTPRGQDPKALVLLSPESNVPGLQITRPLQSLRSTGLGFLVMHGDVPEDSRDSTKIHQQLSGGKGSERVFLQGYKYKLRGTDLLSADDSAAPPKGILYGFLDRHVKSLNIPWQDRRSRLER